MFSLAFPAKERERGGETERHQLKEERGDAQSEREYLSYGSCASTAGAASGRDGDRCTVGAP